MSNEKSKTNDKVGSVKRTSVQAKGITAHPQRINFQRVQNVLLIWLDNSIDRNSADCRNTINQLHQVVNDINIFTNVNQCIDFLTDIHSENVFMLVSGSLCQNIISLIHDNNQLHTIFIFCGNKTTHEQWVKQWSKIKGVFTEISPICEALKQAVKQCEQNAISISFVATSGDEVSKKNLDQLDPIFMYSQILKEILLTIEFGDEHIRKYINYCRTIFSENDAQLKKVDKLQTEYHTKMPIWWYTWNSFLYSMLNLGLRVMDVDMIIKMGFFITDLHRHIEQLHSEQFTSNNTRETFTVYRGQGMSKTAFDQMTKTQGGLMSFNSFLSTSKNRQVSRLFAESNGENPDLVGILFIITIDPVKSITPFASIADLGYYGDSEDEVLFSMHTVFRIGDITPITEKPRLFQVNLTLTSDNDQDLRVLTDRIREESFPNSEGWYRLGLFLLQVGESAKAQEVYETILEQTTNVGEKARIVHMLGTTQRTQGKYQEAITFYEKALEIYQKTLSPTHLNLAGCYNNLGLTYDDMGDYPKALSYFEKDLEISKQSLPANHPDLGGSYNNIGAVYEKMSDYPKALSSHEKALEIRKQLLPANHPDLAYSYNNIGNVHDRLGDYPKALSYYEKALEIRKQSLPATHPDLGASYNNIGNVYGKMGDYPKALSYYEKDLEIRKQSLPANHPDLGASYNNIGNVYDGMGDYPEALSCYEKALEIRKQSLSANHPDLGMSYNNIGVVYYNMDDYRKAFSYFEKALEIRKQSLTANHPNLGMSYNNIGNVHDKMGDYSQALSSHEKALEIRKQSLPANHPDLGASYNNIGNVYDDMGDYPKALSYYEKALEIRKQSLTANHPDLGASYNNIGVVYEHMRNYSKAHSFYERAVTIGEHSLRANHPRLQGFKTNLERVKKQL